MRPLNLRVSAFGPYARTQDLAFDALGDHALFLIHGPTGAGKSSLLDAICYALYGDSSGGERKAEDLRSHHAEPHTPTEVAFSFGIGASAYRVTRRPAYDRPLKRGSGVTKEPGTATLERLTRVDGSVLAAATLATSPTDVAERIIELLGFECAQFRQVAMLPQGRFEQFLLAKSGDREDILRALFETSQYVVIEERLDQEARQLSERLRERRAQRDGILKPFKVDTIDALHTCHTELEQAHTALIVQLEAAHTRREQAWDALQTGQDAARLLKEHTDARARLDAVMSRSGTFAKLRGTVEQGERAARLDDLAQSVATRRREAAARQTQLEAAIQQQDAALIAQARVAQILVLETARADERAAAAQVEEEAKRISEYAGAAAQLRQQFIETSQSFARLEDEHSREAQALEALRATTPALLEAVQASLVAAAQLDGLQRKVAQLQQLQRQVAALRLLEGEIRAVEAAVAAAEGALGLAKQQYQEREQEHQALQQQWVAGQAARLALQLLPAHPCPVCGALDHPAPTHTNVTLVVDATLEEAREGLEQARKAWEAARGEVIAQQQRHMAHTTRYHTEREALSDDAERDLAFITSQIGVAQATLGQAERTATAQVEREQKLQANRHALAEAEERCTALGTMLNDQRRAVDQLRALVEDREQHVPLEQRDPQKAEERAHRAALHAQMLRDSFARAQREATQAHQTLEQAALRVQERSHAAQEAVAAAVQEEALFAERMAQAGFGERAVYEAARLELQTLTELQEQLRVYETALLQAQRDALRASKAAEGLTAPNLPALQAASDEAEMLWDTLNRTEAETKQTLGHMTQARDELLLLQGDLQIQEQRHLQLRLLSDVAKGKNERHISFHRYMLAQRLEEVLYNATLRLQTMSNGRYQLQRLDGRRKGNATAGLDIEIDDVYTGRARKVETLSGGERFLASLSLALGLSDTVQAEAGGRYLETLFIDEGFGALDEQTLDQCMQVLLDLQQGGRLVGIISHVPALLERIPARLTVERSQIGSQAHFHIA